MIHEDSRARRLAYALSALAGYVDAVGFLMVGGFFVSFMSGNTTRLAVGIVDRAEDWQRAALLILSFFAGVVAGSLVGRLATRRHRAVLALVTGLLAISAVLAGLGRPLLAGSALALAMGAENATFERDGEVRIGLTYMTGTLVKAGQRLAGALVGEDRSAIWPHATLWAALSLGAIAGAVSYRFIGMGALWPAVLASAACTIASGRLDRQAAP
jgi:uncharacterized membrane protein YoaK (UPF0700 family)